MSGIREKPFWIAFLVCAVAAMAPIWFFKYPPMVDLPLHAAQVSVLRHFNDPAYGFVGQYDINWFTPYALAYYLAVLFSFLFSVPVAMKIVVSISVLMMPLSYRAVLRQTSGDLWWSLIGFPVSFGLAFVWGFFNYMFAVPIAIFCIAAALRYAYHPRRENARGLFALSVLVFFSHGVAFAMCSIVNTWIVFTYPSRLLHRLRRFWPVWAPGLVALLWYCVPDKGVPRVDSYIQWNAYGLGRLAEIPALMVSVNGDRHAFLIGTLLLFAVALGARLGIDIKRLGGFALLVAIFYLSPFHFLGHSFIYSRLAPFLVVGLFLCTTASRERWRALSSRTLILVLVLWWGAVDLVRFRGFATEVSDYEQVMQQALPNRSLMALTFDRNSAFTPAEQFYHFAAWYQAEKGGQLGYSIAYLYNPIVRYKPGREPLSFAMSNSVWTNPGRMNWKDYGGFDYFLVRTMPTATHNLFADSGGDAVLVSQAGSWSLFKNIKKVL